MHRRTVIGGALVALLASPGRVLAKEKTPKDPFVLLLNGPYLPVALGAGPDLGLSGVDLNDGSYSTTQIFPVHVGGIPWNANENTPIGRFYTQFAGDVAVYQLPGGAISMQFIQNCGGLNPTPDGLPGNGVFLNGTLELKILEATGIYRSFKHGHNHMVDRLHLLDDGTFDEYCFCFITRHGDSE